MKKLLTLTLSVMMICLLTGIAQAQSTENKTAELTSGSNQTWNAPVGTWKIISIEAWGGGGGGGSLNGNSPCGAAGGGGGAHATYSTVITGIVPGPTDLKYSVGGQVSGGNDGNSSSVSYNGTTLINVGGGKKGGTANRPSQPGLFGTNTTTATGGGGGAVITGIGSGGANGTGQGYAGSGVTVSRSSISTTYPNGGAGGAGASGGDGGSAKTSNGPGNAGTAPGGGGSGARNGGSGTQTGGSGARGQVNITYQILTLTVNFDANYTGGSNPASQTVLYYGEYGTLPTVARDNYIFLGWFTAASGGTQVTTTTTCTSTENVTLYAHWASTGEIADGSTEVSPCGDYQVFNTTAADAIAEQTIVYSWGYSLNGADEVSLDVDKLELTQADLTLDHMGAYVFTRYVNVLGQKVASLGQYTVNVYSVNPGEISSDTKYTCTTGDFTISSVTDATPTSAGTVAYEWRYSKDGGAETEIANSNKNELTQDDVTLSENGTYVFKRYATIGCAEAVAATGSYTLNVVVLPTSYATPTTNYTELCEGGTVVVTGENYTLSGVAAPHNLATKFNWMISKDGAAAEPASQSATYTQELSEVGTYTIYAAVEYFNDAKCAVNTTPVSVTVSADPTIAVPTMSVATSICPNGEVTLTAASIVGGVGDGYTYNWEFMGATATDWAAISEAEATYNTTTGTTITASNFISTGDVQYRTYVSNAQGCDAYSSAKGLEIITVDVPSVISAMDVCPAPGDTAFTTMVNTTDPTYQLRWFADATSTTEITAPTTPLASEAVLTYYVAQFNPDNGCLSARVPVTLTITYTAHLGHDNGDLDQIVCQNSAMDAITFSHSGDCAPQVTFTKDGQDVNQIAGVTVTSGNGSTVIEGTPTEAATYTFHVELHPDAQTVCAAPNSFNGSILVNPVYNVVDNQTICGGSYTISDQMGHSYSFTESGTYTKTLEAVTGCDSVVTLNLYVHEWNQFGFEENESLIAGWTSFSNVNSPISADVNGSVSGSQITYQGWNGSNSNGEGNLNSSSSLISTSGNALALINGVSQIVGSPNMNNNKSIVVKTSTSELGNVKMRFDYGVQRTSLAGQWSGNDHGFTTVKMSYSLDGNQYHNLPTLNVNLEDQALTEGSYEVNLSSESSYKIENKDNIYIKLEFSGAKKSGTGLISAYTNYFLLDNLCISGTQLKDLELVGETQACTNQSLTLVATPPYTNTNVTPNVTTPVVYKWERIVGGVSTVLDETSNVLIDNDVQAGNYQYKVSVGSAPCGQSATFDVLGIDPAYHPEIVRHGYVCSNEVDQVSNITFTDDCHYENGMFIVTPSAEDMRTPGTYTCQLSIPTTTNPCDSIITLVLDVLKAFDTTVVAHICLGETYNLYGFNITPTEEGITYYTSDPTWKCSTGCDSIYRLTLITNSVRQTLVDVPNVTLAAWPMDNGISNFVPACGVKTTGSSFMVEGASNVPPFANVAGHAPASDYCYAAASSNGALTWPNLASICSGIFGSASYTDYSGAYFEIKLNPYDYENLKLKFDYKRDNASTNNAQAFNQVRYAYKFSETGSYTTIGTANINSEDWASQTLDFSTANTLDHDVVYLKVEFIGGNPGSTQSCGTFSGSKYLPSYITVDNVMIWGDRPARATLDNTKQTCSDEYVCEGENVTFNCQGDDTYFKFYVVDETANDTIAFNGNPSLSITPTQTSTYKIVGVEQTTMCDSVWGPFNVELIKKPTIAYVSGSNDEGICGNNVFDIEISIEDADSYTFTWLTNGYVVPDGIDFSNNNGTITIGGVLTNGGSAKYYIEANPDNRCSTSSVTQNGTIAARVMPTFTQTLGSDTVCQGDTMQFVITNMDDLNFTLVPEGERFAWTTATATLSNKDTLAYKADEATHTARHYLTVKQNGCTTIDSVDIVVYNLDGDTLRLNGGHYVMNYGDIYLDADSLKLPELMHNGEAVEQNMIASITQSGGAKIYPNNMTDLTTTITWTITDQCGKEHTRVQTLTFELPPCGDADHFTVTDVDGNTYSTVRMGLNCWMRENLKTLNYANGTPVAKAMGYVNNQFPNADNTAAIFGRLYSWYSAMNLPEGSTATPTTNEFGHVQGVCPDGWFMPTPEYFMALHDIDMDHMRTNTYWLDGGGDNSTDFSILPGGAYNSDKDRFENILGNAYFWTTDLTGSGQPKTFVADCHCYMWQILDSSTNHGFSVRCVKDKEKAN